VIVVLKFVPVDVEDVDVTDENVVVVVFDTVDVLVAVVIVVDVTMTRAQLAWTNNCREPPTISTHVSARGEGGMMSITYWTGEVSRR
jgi:hypothetical protein